MKLTIRRIGNSMGVILPKSMLDRWGLGEGDALELTGRGIRPPGNPGLSHERLDEHKRALALAVVRRFTPQEIRAHWPTCTAGNDRVPGFPLIRNGRSSSGAETTGSSSRRCSDVTSAPIAFGNRHPTLDCCRATRCES